MSGYRASLRLARREALRSKGRSLLVVLMIGVPMLGLAFADVAMRTGQVSRAEQARRAIGAADLVAEAVSSEPITQDGMWSYGPGDGAKPSFSPPEDDPDVASLLPPGSRVVRWRTYYAVRFRHDDRAESGEVEHMDAGDPIARGLVSLDRGAFPRAAGEVAVTTKLARDLGLGIGDTVRVGRDDTYRVTGIVVARGSLSSAKVFLPASSPPPGDTGLATDSGRRYAVDLPPGVRDLDLVPALNEAGMRVVPRTWFLHPPPSDGTHGRVDAEAVGVAVVAVGLATLEIVLLAGTAFAVGARRKRRELALVAATGGDRRDVRRVVLAEGVVLGAVAGLFGVSGGVALVFFGRPLLERFSGSLMGPLDLRALELGAIVAVGAGTALLATLLPARTASRQPVVAALTGRRGEARVRKRVPIVALVAVAAGAALAFWASGSGTVVTRADGLTRQVGRPANFTLVLAGAALAELGFVACAPALVALVGGLASRLPLPLRLAARDAARHRTRSGPAVAAVVAAVAGSVALSVYVASDVDRQRRQYEPNLPSGYVTMGRGDPANPVAEEDVEAAVRALPVRERIEVREVLSPCDGVHECTYWTVEVPLAHRCPDTPFGCGFGPRPSQLVVSDARYVSVWNGRDDDRVARALAEGKAVVFDERWLQDGRLTLRGEVIEEGQLTQRVRNVTIPAVVAAKPREAYSGTPGAVLSADTARRHGLPTFLPRLLLATSRMPTAREEAAALGALTRVASYADLQVERGFRHDAGLVLLALVGGAAFVTMASTGIATGLAAADSRPDLATLAAVGAAPRVRRVLAMAQATMVASMGSALGILAGLVPAFAIVGARAEYRLAMPWASLAVVLVGVPVLAALLVGLVTRSRLPMERRIA